jgi:protein-S-isoprenylcysteine O-methyltransferase Ste14
MPASRPQKAGLSDVCKCGNPPAWELLSASAVRQSALKRRVQSASRATKRIAFQIILVTVALIGCAFVGYAVKEAFARDWWPGTFGSLILAAVAACFRSPGICKNPSLKRSRC